MTAYEDLELRAPGTDDDEPWPVYVDPPNDHTWAIPAQPDRRGWALALAVLIVAVVAIVWWR